jgi:alpha-L-fucosidase 2
MLPNFFAINRIGWKWLVMGFFMAVAFHAVAQLSPKEPISPYLIWYDKPAANWNEALPVGNGYLGTMVFGRGPVELIQLNDATLWTGGPADLNPNPQAYLYLPKSREALFKGNYQAVTTFLRQMQGPDTQKYQPLGDLVIRYQDTSSVVDVYRELDLKTAVTTTRFRSGGVEWTRQVFASAPDSVLVIKLTASQKGQLNVSFFVHHPLPHGVKHQGNDLVLFGQLPGSGRGTSQKSALKKNEEGMFFQFRVRVASTDGHVQWTDSSMEVSQATEAVFRWTSAPPTTVIARSRYRMEERS